MTKERDIAAFLSKTEAFNVGNRGLAFDSGAVSTLTPTIATGLIGQYGGVVVYSTIDSLPANPTDGDRAWVKSNDRFYIADSSWHNSLLVNAPSSINILNYDSALHDSQSLSMTIQVVDSFENLDIITFDAVLSPSNITDSAVLSFTRDSSVVNISMRPDTIDATRNFSITFSANDQVNISTVVKDFTVSSPESTGTLNSNSATVNEGSSVTFSIPTTGYPDGTTFPYTITGISSSDITQSLTGNMTVSSNVASITIDVVSDGTTEGNEAMTFTADGQSVGVTILDTSGAPTYSLSRNYSSRNEGQIVTFTMTTTNIADGTTIAYSVTGIDAADLSSGSLTGNFTINSNSGSVSFTFAADQTTEGDETMTLTSQGQSLTCTVVDTSQAPVYSVGSIITGTDQASSVSSTNTQIFNYSYSSIGSSGVNATIGQVGDWIYWSTPFYNQSGFGNITAHSGGNTYISPYSFSNGWSNYGYQTNIYNTTAWGTISRSLYGISSNERTGRVAWRYAQGSTSQTAEQGVFQMAALNITDLGAVSITSTSNLNNWNTTTGHGYNFSGYNDIGSSDWSNMSYNSTGSGRWNCTQYGPQGANLYAASNGTGIRGNPGPGGEFYTHVQYQSTSQIGYYWLRSPEFTLSSSSLTVSAKYARRGANMGSLYIYWIPS